MLSENIKILRKQKGYTQETLAQQINVVRQTVSKWEKGISVPDAEMLNTLSELFEVPVSRLLGSTINENGTAEAGSDESAKIDEVAKQLAILNEQLANQAARKRKLAKKIFIAIGAVIAGLILLFILCFGALVMLRVRSKSQLEFTETTLECELNGETYMYSLRYDQNFRIHEEGGDAFISNHIDLQLHISKITLTIMAEASKLLNKIKKLIDN